MDTPMPDFILQQIRAQTAIFIAANVAVGLICAYARTRLLKHALFDAIIALLLSVLIMALAFRRCFFLG